MIIAQHTTQRLHIDLPRSLTRQARLSNEAAVRLDSGMSESSLEADVGHDSTLTNDSVAIENSREPTLALPTSQRVPIIVLSPRLSPTPEPGTPIPISPPIGWTVETLDGSTPEPLLPRPGSPDSEDEAAEVLFVSSLRAGTASQRARRQTLRPLLDDSDRALRNAWNRETFDEFLEDELVRQEDLERFGIGGAVEQRDFTAVAQDDERAHSSEDPQFLPSWYLRSLEALVAPPSPPLDTTNADSIPFLQPSTTTSIPSSNDVNDMVTANTRDQLSPTSHEIQPRQQSIWRVSANVASSIRSHAELTRLFLSYDQSNMIDVPRASAILPRGGVRRGSIDDHRPIIPNADAHPISDVRSFVQSPSPQSTLSASYARRAEIARPDYDPTFAAMGTTRLPLVWTDEHRRTPRDTRTLMGRAYRMKEPVVLLYCGGGGGGGMDARDKSSLPEGWHWAHRKRELTAQGCGALICARAVSVRSVEDEGQRQREQWVSDLPPHADIVGDVICEADHLSQVNPEPCFSCSYRELACRHW